MWVTALDGSWVTALNGKKEGEKKGPVGESCSVEAGWFLRRFLSWFHFFMKEQTSKDGLVWGEAVPAWL